MTDLDNDPILLAWERACWQRWLDSNFDDGTLERYWLHSIDQAINEALEKPEVPADA